MGEAKRRAKFSDDMAAFHRFTRDGGYGPMGGAMMVMIARAPLLFTQHLHHLIALAKLVWQHVDRPPLCLACEHEFRPTTSPPQALAVTTPICRDERAPSIITGICENCAKLSDEQLTDRAFQHLKRMGLADCKLGAAQGPATLQ